MSRLILPCSLDVVAPAVTDDNTKGWLVGSHWTDSAAQKHYVATSVATGAAVWKEMTTGGAIASTSAALAAQISDESGTGLVVFNTSPTLVTPALGTPTALVGTNITGTASGFTAGDATKVAATTPTATGLAVLAAVNAAAVRTAAALGTSATLNIDTDGTLAANSDSIIPTQKAVKTYADQLIAANDAMIFKGSTDCSTNPNYPAADRGHTYRVSVAGKIGGASGTNVEVGDLFICLTDGTIAGTQAGVGASWTVSPTNIDGAVVGPASATDSDFAQFDGTSGKLIKGGLGSSGTGNVVRVTNAALVTPDLGTPTALVATNATGTAASLTAGNVTTNANLTGDVTSVGNVATIPTSVVSAAARTVVDDATVAAMVDTLGGASSTGTGGLVRATSPTLVTPALGTPASGVITNLTGNARGAVVTSRLEGSAPAQSSHTGDTAETTLATFSVAAGHGLTAGSIVLVSFLATMTNNANAKTFKVKIGSSAFVNLNVPSVATWQKQVPIILRSTSSEVVFPVNNSNTWGSTGGAISTFTEDLSGAFTITITGTLGSGTDTMSIESAWVQLQIL